MRRYIPSPTAKQTIAWSAAAVLIAVSASTGAFAQQGAGETDAWHGIAGLGYAFKWCEVTAVWPCLYYDLPPDKPIRDMNFNGPVVGITFRW